MKHKMLLSVGLCALMYTAVFTVWTPPNIRDTETTNKTSTQQLQPKPEQSETFTVTTASGLSTAQPSDIMALRYENALKQLTFLPAHGYLKKEPHSGASQEETLTRINTLMAVPHVSNSVVLQLATGVSREQFAHLQAELGLQLVDHFHFSEEPIVTLTFPDFLNMETVLERLLNSGIIADVELDTFAHVTQLNSNDPYRGYMWGLYNDGSFFGGTAGMDTGAIGAWNIQPNAANVIVAVIDTGVDTSHPDLDANIWSGKGYDFYRNDANPNDEHGHGTHVAGIIAAEHNNGQGVMGIANQVQIMAVKAASPTGSLSLTNRLKAFAYVLEQGADIVNASFGGSSYSSSEFSAISALNNAGITVVAAAGNDGKSLNAKKFYPACYDLDNIISVGAHGMKGERASFSNYSPQYVDVFAPGKYIYSTLPGNKYGFKSGTSMAAPFVAGGMALLKAKLPDWGMYELIEVLYSATNESTDLGAYSHYGKVNFAQALEFTPEAPQLVFEPGNEDVFSLTSTGQVMWTKVVDGVEHGNLFIEGPSVPLPWELFGYEDIDVDGKGEIVFTNPDTGAVAFWNLEGPAFASTETLQVLQEKVSYNTRGLTYKITADFDADGHNDILWQNEAGECVIWYMVGTTHNGTATIRDISGSQLAVPFSRWNFVGYTDFEQDGQLELIWQGLEPDVRGKLAYWTINDRGLTDKRGITDFTLAASCTAVGTGDITNDGQPDLIYRDGSGYHYAMVLQGNRSTKVMELRDTVTRIPVSTDWVLKGITDLDGNSADKHFIWYRARDNATAQWNVNTSGTTTSRGIIPTPDLRGMQFLGVGSFSSQTPEFLLLRNEELTLTTSSVQTTTSGFIASAVSEDAFQETSTEDFSLDGYLGGVGDYENNGQMDIVVHTHSGHIVIYPLEGNRVADGTVISYLVPQAAAPIEQKTAPSTPSTEGLSYRFEADFNADGNTDIIWQNRKGECVIWYLSNGEVTRTVTVTDVSGTPLAVPFTRWNLVGYTDFEQDGQLELIWHGLEPDVRGKIAYWTINDAGLTGNRGLANFALSASNIAVGTSDITRDGQPDLIYRDSYGYHYAMALQGNKSGGVMELRDPDKKIPVSTDWELMGTAESDSSDTTRLIWYRAKDDATAQWTVHTNGYIDSRSLIDPVDTRPTLSNLNHQGTEVTASSPSLVYQEAEAVVTDPNLRVWALFDWDGAKGLDLLWENTREKTQQVWVMDLNFLATEQVAL